MSINPGHDGAVAFIKNGELFFCFEAEKDSNLRHRQLPPSKLLEAFNSLSEIPDVIAVGGWQEGDGKVGYHGAGIEHVRNSSRKMLGVNISFFESTHERSHIFCSYGLSPFDQHEPCYLLIWEGQIGAFYEIDERLNVTKFPTVISFPGYKYSFLFDLADPGKRLSSWSLSSAGKLMALAGYSSRGISTSTEQRMIDQVLSTVVPSVTDKMAFQWSPYVDCGVTAPHFTELIGKFSDALFQKFLEFARTYLTKGYPLLIGGGCGLNCEWNTLWKQSGLFKDVFIPPVANDSGSAIGTAVEAQFYCSGEAKISWDVYRGADFIHEELPSVAMPVDLNYRALAERLASGRVAAWVQGRCEIGPRALGHRSLLAAPFKAEMRDRLNLIKKRESYRPIAPVCLEDDAQKLFGIAGASPYMLEFHQVLNPHLRAVTHVDGSARVQTVNAMQDPELYRLLEEFKRLTGYGVLCNTSLNLPGRGFINRTSDLFRYVKETGIEDVIVDGHHYDQELFYDSIKPHQGVAF